MAGENPNDQAASLHEIAVKKLTETQTEVAKLQEDKKELEATVTLLKNENEALNAVNDELTAKVEELSKPAAEAAKEAPEEKLEVPSTTFKVGKEEYRFVAPVFHYKGQRILAKNALSDAALLKELVDKKAGIIAKA